MVFTFLFEISDLWHHLVFFSIISKIKPNFPFIGFSVKKEATLTFFSQNCNFFEVLHELIESIWKEFWAKVPVCIGLTTCFHEFYEYESTNIPILLSWKRKQISYWSLKDFLFFSFEHLKNSKQIICNIWWKKLRD